MTCYFVAFCWTGTGNIVVFFSFLEVTQTLRNYPVLDLRCQEKVNYEKFGIKDSNSSTMQTHIC